MSTAAPRNWPDLLVFSGAAVLLAWGWQQRHDSLLTAEYGAGYWLGILGGGLMLVLLLYPLRKKARWMHWFGSVAAWFRVHMWFGVLGPVAVLWHANFQLGSLNSNVALFAMLAVAVSGVVGRYLYTRVHRSLYQARMEIADLRQTLRNSRAGLGEALEQIPGLAGALQRCEELALAPVDGLGAAVSRGLRISAALRRVRRAARRHLGTALPAPEARRNARGLLDRHLAVIRRSADVALFDRLLTFWHLLHLPLFIMLVITGWVHVYAVHAY